MIYLVDGEDETTILSRHQSAQAALREFDRLRTAGTAVVPYRVFGEGKSFTARISIENLRASARCERPRDTHRGRAYQVEARLLHRSPCLSTTASAEAFCRRLIGVRVPVVRNSRLRGAQARYGRSIEVGTPWSARGTPVSLLCHELAHVIASSRTVRGHGPEWAGVYLALIAEAMGEAEAESLRRAFLRQRVPVSKDWEIYMRWRLEARRERV